MKKTIVQTVQENEALLKSLKTHTELREWAVLQGWDNRSAFPKFKTALNAIGINYDNIKLNILKEKEQKAEEKLALILKNASESEKNIRKIAEEISGNVWIKEDKRRIYVEGGNNYQYNGKWWVDFNNDGSFSAKVYLEEGYHNQNREGYCKKYLNAIINDVDNAMEKLNISEKDLAIDGEVTFFEEKDLPPVDICIAGTLDDLYCGCGSYYIAINEKKEFIASLNFSSSMGEFDRSQKLSFEKELKNKNINYFKILTMDGSGTKFFFRKEEDADGFNVKIYTVPAYGGGTHKNIELL